MSSVPGTVVVTGASGDLGLDLVRRCLAQGAEVLAQYRSRPQRLNDLDPSGKHLFLVRGDLADDGAQFLAAAVPDHWHGVDLLVNCVGGARPTPIDDLPADEFRACLLANVEAPYAALRALLEPLARARGSVVNLSSVAAFTGGAFGPHYAAAKAAVIGLTRSAARELGPRGIRVNCVAPGPVASEMTDSLGTAALEGVLAGTALGRVVRPEEITDTVLALAGATATTGQTVVVDGGRYLH
ncbi:MULTISPECIES: SDR family NAD(P)-dependent oxidoreductase [Streptomyces]|uniref:SDR family NAD(P)-dependent oxidoreductase n=1 Tax=Streptomyces TaxID=1883 RepID=UPI0013024F4B|nr:MULTISPECIES: SDR family oxidoreductase [Streptomyces]MDN5383867.1 SDR family oxidoreductase [Streptomyces sp. LB8]